MHDVSGVLTLRRGGVFAKFSLHPLTLTEDRALLDEILKSEDTRK
jgi:hypothetical protein